MASFLLPCGHRVRCATCEANKIEKLEDQLRESDKLRMFYQDFIIRLPGAPPEKDIEIVMQQTGACRNDAIYALVRNKCDIINSIIELSPC